MLKTGASVLLSIIAAALIAHALSPWLPPESLALAFVAPIILVAIRHGFWASLAASVLGVFAVNFFFVEPRYTFVVARPQDAAALAVFAIVAALSSALAARARLAAQSAERRAEQAALLQSLAAELAAAQNDSEVANAAAVSMARLSEARALVIAADERHWGDGYDEGADQAARWSMAEKQPFKPSLEAPLSTTWAFWPVIIGGRALMAVGADAPPNAELESGAEQIAALAALALARVAAADVAARARLEAARERLKSDLLAGVSHDLRTPLSTILFTLQSLQRFAEDHPPEARAELLSLAEREAARLSAMVEALLDASRIGTEGAPVRMTTVAPADLIARTLSAIDGGADDVVFVAANAEKLPRVRADADLAERALANVLANARRHGAGKIEIETRNAPAGVEISVRDHGPGLGDHPERLFEPFVRGAEGDGRAPGLGLGLSIARKFLEAQGARIDAEDAPGGGAIFTLRFARADMEPARVR